MKRRDVLKAIGAGAAVAVLPAIPAAPEMVKARMTIDGVVVASGRALGFVTEQTEQTENGIYVIKTVTWA